METTQPSFHFTLYRFVGPQGERTTAVVRDISIADGMRSLFDQNKSVIKVCRESVQSWAAHQGLCISAKEPFPSTKHMARSGLSFDSGLSSSRASCQ